MGMFNHVRYEAPCAKCGAILTDWQSKDHPVTMTTLDPHLVRNFYTSCDACKQWNEYDVIPRDIVLVRRVPSEDHI